MNGSPKPKILILSGDLGDGHKQAARAIAEAARLQEPGMEVEIVDFMEWTHPHLHNVARYCYTQWVTKFPSVYGYLFGKTRTDNPFSYLFKKVKFYTFSRMLKLLQDSRPSIVVSTFPPAAAAMSLLKANGLTTVPTATVITDHTDHSYWIHPYTDRYLVGSDHVRTALLRQRIPELQVTVTGIPVRPAFAETYDREALRAKHGLDPSLPVILMMGGGLGLIGKDSISMLLENDIIKGLQIVVICGRNDKLRGQLAEELQDAGERIRLTGYVDNIHEWMAMSDLVVTKPGGLTTSEALALELPMLLFKPLPGQEQDNAAYLEQCGVAQMAEDDADLQIRLERLFRLPSALGAMRANAKRCRRRTSASDALAAILDTRNASLPHPTLGRAVYAEA